VKTESYKYLEDKDIDRPFISKYDIQIRGYYLYKALPFVKVTFIDVQKAVRLMEARVILDTAIHSKRAELIPYEELNGFTSSNSTANGFITKEVVIVSSNCAF